MNHHIVVVVLGDRKVGFGLVKATKLDGGGIIGFGHFYGRVKATKPHEYLLSRVSDIDTIFSHLFLMTS